MQVKINNLDMQMNISSEVTPIPRKCWECQFLGKLKLQKAYLQLWPFDVSAIRCFKGSLELDKRFVIISIMVVNCNRYHRPVGNDALKLNSTKLINPVNTEEFFMQVST